MSNEIITHYDPADHSPEAKAGRRKSLLKRMGGLPLSDVKTCELPWLWPGRIPLGEVTLLAGDPGMGKSLVALDLAARVTRGEHWPDTNSHVAQAPGSVILLSSEDRLAATIRPRLEEAAADCSRIVALPLSVTLGAPSFWGDEGPRQGFELRSDLHLLRSLIHQVTDCRLVVVDSLNSYLTENTEKVPADDRQLLVRLVGIAREARVAVLLITHLRKKGGRAIYCSLGSLAFVAAARAVWAVTKDPESASRRLFLPIKNNLATDASGLAFAIDTGPIHGAARVCWSSEPVSVAPDMVVNHAQRNGRPDHERQHAQRWLHEQLASGPRLVKELREEADVNGFSPSTLRRAFRALEGQAVREGTHPKSRWLWRLPKTDDQNPSGEFWTSVKNAEKTV
jgi:putative DNA primase/helicase